MRILMLSSTFPYPPSQGGTEVRTFHLMRALQQRHQVTMVTQRSPHHSVTDVEALRQQVETLVEFPLPATSHAASGTVMKAKAGLTGKLSRLGAATLQGVPTNVRHRYSPTLQAWVDAAVAANQFDVITCEHSVNAVYVRPAFRQQLRTVLNAHSLMGNSLRAQLAVGASAHPWRDRLSLPAIDRYEQRFQQQFERVVVTTEGDRQQFLQLGGWNAENEAHPQGVWVVPNGVDLATFPQRLADPDGRQLVFVGAMDSPHNIDAVQFFVETVLPPLRSRYPEVTFSIVGQRPTAAVQALAAQPGVRVLGAVPSVAAALHQATVCILPLRLGFGIKNKTLEAMAAGVPVIGSDRALEGLTVDGKGVPLRALRANTVDEYLAATERLLDYPDLRRHIAAQARSMIERHYSWETMGQAYHDVVVDEMPG